MEIDELTPAAKLIMDNFEETAKQRAAELMTGLVPGEPLHGVRLSAFCLGYTAGVVDFGAMLRDKHGVTSAQLSKIFEAVCAWRDGACSGEQLIAVIDEARKGQS
jgi:hypothetical protein